jgi:hypothetical protein
MRQVLFSLALGLIVDAHAQGLMVFNNRGGAWGLDAPITFRETGTGPGSGYSAGLYFDGNLVPGSVTTFRSPTPTTPQVSKYIQPLTVAIPGTTFGQMNVVVEMRVWPTHAGSYETAREAERGRSGPLVLTQLYDGGPSDYGHFQSSFTGFQISIPEPSALVVGILGGTAFLVRFRLRWWTSTDASVSAYHAQKP